MKGPVYAFGSLGRVGFAPTRQLETLHRLCAPIAACLFGEFTHLVINNYKKLRLETFALEEMPIGQQHINWDEEIVHLEPSDPDRGKATFEILHGFWFFYLSEIKLFYFLQ